MMNLLKISALVFLSSSVVGCGGEGGGGSASAPAVPSVQAIEDTVDIVAAPDFSFDIGKKITVSMDYAGVTDGALHLYVEAAHTMDNGEIIADPTSRITTLYPTRVDTVELEVNGNWSQLYVQWVPMSAQETEKNWVIELNEPSDSYLISF